MSVDSSILKKYEDSIPVRQLSVNRVAQQALMSQAMRQAWFDSQKPSLIPEDVLAVNPLSYQLTVTPDGNSLQNMGSELQQRAFLMKLGLNPPNEVVSLDAWLVNELRDLQQYDSTGRMQPTLASFMSLPEDARQRVVRRVNPPGLTPPVLPRAPLTPSVEPSTTPRVSLPTRRPPPRLIPAPTDVFEFPFASSDLESSFASLSSPFQPAASLPGQNEPPLVGVALARQVAQRSNATDRTVEEGLGFAGETSGLRSGTTTTSPIARVFNIVSGIRKVNSPRGIAEAFSEVV